MFFKKLYDLIEKKDQFARERVNVIQKEMGERFEAIQKEMDSNFIKSQTSYDEIYESLTKFTEDIRKIYEVWNNSDHLRELSEELRLYIEHLDNLNQNQLYQHDTHLQSLLIEAKNLMETISDFLKLVSPNGE